MVSDTGSMVMAHPPKSPEKTAEDKKTRNLKIELTDISTILGSVIENKGGPVHCISSPPSPKSVRSNTSSKSVPSDTSNPENLDGNTSVMSCNTGNSVHIPAAATGDTQIKSPSAAEPTRRTSSRASKSKCVAFLKDVTGSLSAKRRQASELTSPTRNKSKVTVRKSPQVVVAVTSPSKERVKSSARKSAIKSNRLDVSSVQSVHTDFIKSVGEKIEISPSIAVIDTTPDVSPSKPAMNAAADISPSKAAVDATADISPSIISAVQTKANISPRAALKVEQLNLDKIVVCDKKSVPSSPLPSGSNDKSNRSIEFSSDSNPWSMPSDSSTICSEDTWNVSRKSSEKSHNRLKLQNKNKGGVKKSTLANVVRKKKRIQQVDAAPHHCSNEVMVRGNEHLLSEAKEIRPINNCLSIGEIRKDLQDARVNDQDYKHARVSDQDHQDVRVINQDVRVINQDVRVINQDVRVINQDVRVSDQDHQDFRVNDQDVRICDQDHQDVRACDQDSRDVVTPRSKHSSAGEAAESDDSHGLGSPRSEDDCDNDYYYKDYILTRRASSDSEDNEDRGEFCLNLKRGQRIKTYGSRAFRLFGAPGTSPRYVTVRKDPEEEVSNHVTTTSDSEVPKYSDISDDESVPSAIHNTYAHTGSLLSNSSTYSSVQPYGIGDVQNSNSVALQNFHCMEMEQREGVVSGSFVKSMEQQTNINTSSYKDGSDSNVQQTQRSAVKEGETVIGSVTNEVVSITETSDMPKLKETDCADESENFQTVKNTGHFKLSDNIEVSSYILPPDESESLNELEQSIDVEPEMTVKTVFVQDQLDDSCILSIARISPTDQLVAEQPVQVCQVYSGNDQVEEQVNIIDPTAEEEPYIVSITPIFRRPSSVVQSNESSEADTGLPLVCNAQSDEDDYNGHMADTESLDGDDVSEAMEIIDVKKQELPSLLNIQAEHDKGKDILGDNVSEPDRPCSTALTPTLSNSQIDSDNNEKSVDVSNNSVRPCSTTSPPALSNTQAQDNNSKESFCDDVSVPVQFIGVKPEEQCSNTTPSALSSTQVKGNDSSKDNFSDDVNGPVEFMDVKTQASCYTLPPSTLSNTQGKDDNSKDSFSDGISMLVKPCSTASSPTNIEAEDDNCKDSLSDEPYPTVPPPASPNFQAEDSVSKSSFGDEQPPELVNEMECIPQYMQMKRSGNCDHDPDEEFEAPILEPFEGQTFINVNEPVGVPSEDTDVVIDEAYIISDAFLKKARVSESYGNQPSGKSLESLQREEPVLHRTNGNASFESAIEEYNGLASKETYVDKSQQTEKSKGINITASKNGDDFTKAQKKGTCKDIRENNSKKIRNKSVNIFDHFSQDSKRADDSVQEQNVKNSADIVNTNSPAISQGTKNLQEKPGQAITLAKKKKVPTATLR